MSHVAYISAKFDEVLVECPFNVKWMHAIAKAIPATDRRRVGSVWYFHPRWYKFVNLVTSECFVQSSNLLSEQKKAEICVKWKQMVVAPDYYGPIQAAAASTNGVYDTLHVTMDAPEEVVTAAYRALVKIHHPDKGGDPDTFRAIHAAYEEIKNERANDDEAGS